MRAYLLLAVSLIIWAPVYAKRVPVSGYTNPPWLTGPIYAPSGHVTPIGSVNFEPYIGVIDRNAEYDSHWKKKKVPSFLVCSTEYWCTFGLTQWMDILIGPSIDYNICQGSHRLHFPDFEVGTNFQLLMDREDNYLPGIKLGLREWFPVGKFEHLDPALHGTDQGGFGAFETTVLLCASRLFHLRGDHWLNLRLVYYYSVATRFHVHGYNLHGGAPNTDGYVYPPQWQQFDLAMEWTLTKNWAFACEFLGTFEGPRKFKGDPGQLDTGEIPVMTRGSSDQYMLVPAVEYNWSAKVGMIAGVGFTVVGRNCDSLIAPQIGINVYF